MDFEVSNDVLCNANNLRNNGIQKKQIKENVIDILRKINEELRTAHMEGKHIIVTEMPIIFDIANMNNSDAQRAIWANVVSILKAKQFRVWICPKRDYCKLKITWISEEDELLFQSQKNILEMHTREFN